jgi:hypothetical protein
MSESPATYRVSPWTVCYGYQGTFALHVDGRRLDFTRENEAALREIFGERFDLITGKKREVFRCLNGHKPRFEFDTYPPLCGDCRARMVFSHVEVKP